MLERLTLPSPNGAPGKVPKYMEPSLCIFRLEGDAAGAMKRTEGVEAMKAAEEVMVMSEAIAPRDIL